MKTTICFFAFSFTFVACAPGFATADIGELYSTNTWADANYLRLVNSGDEIDLAASSYTNLTISSQMIPIAEDMDYVVQSPQGASFRVQGTRGDSCSSACLSLLERVSMSSAPQPFPSLDFGSTGIGDHAFRGWNGNSTNSVFFVRNNVFFRIRAQNGTESVIPLARFIDDQILMLSTNALIFAP